jgi:hypothetical protein
MDALALLAPVIIALISWWLGYQRGLAAGRIESIATMRSALRDFNK